MDHYDGDGEYISFIDKQQDEIKEQQLEFIDMNKKNEVNESESCSSKDALSSNDDSSVEMELEDTVLNEPPIEDLKKNLGNEEEFQLVDHLEPIHIFLKIKPLTIQEINKQQDVVILFFLFILFWFLIKIFCFNRNISIFMVILACL